MKRKREEEEGRRRRRRKRLSVIEWVREAWDGEERE